MSPGIFKVDSETIDENMTQNAYSKVLVVDVLDVVVIAEVAMAKDIEYDLSNRNLGVLIMG
jgi:hypothetical protein